MSALTAEQEAACAFRQGSVLVAAAAGAGKTTTLSERVVRRAVLDPDPVDIDRFLLVTFTEKAALEMRQRIAGDLARRALAGDARAEEMLERLPLAQISTIHGFCLRLLREEWHAAGLDPEAALLDERQAQILRRASLDATLTEAYRTRGGMPALVAYFGGMGEDDGLREALLDALGFLDILPDPEGFLRQGLLDHAAPEAFDRALRHVVAADRRQVQEAASLLRQAAGLARAAEGDTPYARALEAEALERETAAAQGASDWRQHGAILQSLARFSALSGNSLPQHAPSRRLREQAKKLLGRLAAGMAQLDEPELRERSAASHALLEDFAALLLVAMSDYRREKRAVAALDFSDLEQEAYRLLTADGGRVAAGLRRRYREVLVDEFQDVNPLQAAIIAQVSRAGEDGDLFAVGDVKQSIYGFRHAAPDLFLGHQAEAARRQAALALRQNFRSRREIIEAVNAVFRQLMQEAQAPLYDRDAELVAGRSGATLPPDPDPRVRFVIVPAAGGEGDPGEPDLGSLGREADWIAQEIARLVASQHPVWDAGTGQARPVRYRDCAVLLRGLTTAAATFDDRFAARGVPASIQRAEGYLGGLELQTVQSLLRAVELPTRDWDLLVTLRAPWFGLSLHDVWRVRAAAPGDALWQGLLRLGGEDERFGGIVRRIEDWRAMSLRLPVDRLVHEILADTQYPARVAGLPRGAQRRQDILGFAAAAEEFARRGGGGLGAFLETFEELERQRLDLAPPDVDLGDAVRVTSIHRSKGLEFPIVFVAGLGRRFGGERERRRIRLHRRLGLAAAYADEDGGLHPTPAWEAIDAAVRSEDMREEVRLLYVAMTRARDRLYLTSGRDPGQGAPRLDPAALRVAKSPVEWLAVPLQAEGLPVLWLRPDALEAWPAREETAAGGGTVDIEAAQRAFALLPRRRQAAGERGPLRLSASALSEAESGYGAVLRRRRAGGQGAAAARAAGIHTHRLLELLDLAEPPQDLGLALAELCAAGALPREAERLIDLGAVGRFLQSPTAQRIRGARSLWRELSFSVLADDAGRPDPRGGTVLQGKIDLLLEDAAGFLIVDFKTDHVAADEVPRAAAAYRGQIEAYRAALQAIAGVGAAALLYFLGPGVAVDV